MNEDKNYQDFTRELTYKSTMHHVAHTDNNKAWYEETHETSPIVYAKDLWMDYAYIPEKPIPEVTEYNLTIGQTNVIIYKLIEDLPLEKTDEPNTFYNKDFKQVIDKIGYNVILKCNGEEVPFGLNKWTYDSSSGFLIFLEGLPKGWDGQWTVTFYQYQGRLFENTILRNDGTTQLVDNYYPVEKQDVATKKYVDDHISDTNDIVNKLVPPIPPTLANTKLKLEAEGFPANAVLNGILVDKVVYADQEITITTDRFYNEKELGKTSLYVNDILYGTIKHSDPKDVGFFKVIYNDDFYKTDLNSKGFYSGLQVELKCKAGQFPPYINMIGMTLPVLRFQVVTEFPDGTKYKTNEVSIGVEDTPKEHGFKSLSEYQVKLMPAEDLTWKMVSGVPTIVAGSHLNYSNLTSVTLNKYFIENQKIANIKFFDGEVTDIFPDTKGYGIVVNPEINIEGSIQVPDQYYSETLPVAAQSFTLEQKLNDDWSGNYPIRVDTITDESHRVWSGKDLSHKEGEEWNPTVNLGPTLELQMLNNKVIWPETDFSVNGNGISWIEHWDPEGWIKPGPNYALCPTHGKRYVTFAYDIPYSNGVYITIPELTLVEPFRHFNVNSMELKVLEATDWIDAMKPYDGIGKVRKEGEGCLVVHKCKDNTIYTTFGPDPIKGRLFIRIGITYEGRVPFSMPTIVSNI